MTDELNLDENEVIDPLNPTEDSDDEDLSFLDELEDEPKEEPEGSDALAAYNAEMQKRGLNKNYKSWDDVAKSEKQRDIAFAKKGMEPKEPKKEEVVETPTSNPADSIRIGELELKIDAPDSKYVIDEIKKDHPGKNPKEVYDNSEYYKKEASARAEAERNKARISNPSGGTEDMPEVDETEQKFMNSLPEKYKKK